MADKSARLPRRARVVRNARLTPTGTFLVRFEVLDGEPFEFEPGQFVAVDCEHPELGYRRIPARDLEAPYERMARLLGGAGG